MVPPLLAYSPLFLSFRRRCLLFGRSVRASTVLGSLFRRFRTYCSDTHIRFSLSYQIYLNCQADSLAKILFYNFAKQKTLAVCGVHIMLLNSSKKEDLIMFGRRGSCGCGGDDNFIWLILILIFCCGCDGGDDSCIWIILLLLLCGCGRDTKCCNEPISPCC